MRFARNPSRKNCLTKMPITNCKLTLFLIVVFATTWCSWVRGQTTVRFTDAEPIVQRNQGDSQKPYVLILPGILGQQVWDRNIKNGILKSELNADVEIFDWTSGPLMAGFNFGGNPSKIKYLSERIREFKQRNPSRPLYLIGHSGGCRMVVGILEQLPAGPIIEKALLLSPCLDAYYDLEPAIQSCSGELVSFRSPMDLTISLPLTAVHGLAHGRLSMSASVIGFKNASASNPRFTEIDYEPSMISTGHTGGHFGWTHPAIVSLYIVPLLMPGESDSVFRPSSPNSGFGTLRYGNHRSFVR